MFQYQARMIVCCYYTKPLVTFQEQTNHPMHIYIDSDRHCTTDYYTIRINYEVKMIVILTLKQDPVLNERVAGLKAL